VLPGLLTVQAGPYIRAGGALALFVIVFGSIRPNWFTSPPKPSSDTPPLGKVQPEDTGLVVTAERVPIDFIQKPKKGPTPGCNCNRSAPITFPLSRSQYAVNEDFPFRYDVVTYASDSHLEIPKAISIGAFQNGDAG
jgi:hypothetical protein